MNNQQTTYYVYNVETRVVVETLLLMTQEMAENHYTKNYDTDLYGMTATPAFGCADGLLVPHGLHPATKKKHQLL